MISCIAVLLISENSRELPRTPRTYRELLITENSRELLITENSRELLITDNFRELPRTTIYRELPKTTNYRELPRTNISLDSFSTILNYNHTIHLSGKSGEFQYINAQKTYVLYQNFQEVPIMRGG